MSTPFGDDWVEITPEQAQAMQGSRDWEKEGYEEISAVEAYYLRNAQIEPEYSPVGSFGENVDAAFVKAMADTWRGIRQLAGADVSAELEESRRLDAPLMDTAGGLVGNILGHASQLPVPAATIPRAAALGGLHSFVQPGTPEERVQAAATGAAFGAGGDIAARAFGRLWSPVRSNISPEKAALTAEMERLGIDPLPAERVGSPGLQRFESFLESMPITSRAIQGTKQQNQEILNRIALQEMGAEGSGQISPKVFRDARKNISDIFTQEGSALGNIPLDDDFVRGIKNALDDYQSVWGGRGDPKFNRVVNNAIEEASESGNITGTRYVALRSEMSKMARDAYRTENSRLGEGIDNVIDVLDENVFRQSVLKSTPEMGTGPVEAFGKLKEARRRWQVLKSIEKAVKGEDVSASKLANVLRKADPLGFSFGSKLINGSHLYDSPLYNLARYAELTKNPYGSSGTAERLGALALTGAGIGSLYTGEYGYGALPIAALLGARYAYPSATMQRWLSGRTPPGFGGARPPALSFGAGVGRGVGASQANTSGGLNYDSFGSPYGGYDANGITNKPQLYGR